MSDYTDSKAKLQYVDASVLNLLVQKWLMGNLGATDIGVVDVGLVPNGIGNPSILDIYVVGDLDELEAAVAGFEDFKLMVNGVDNEPRTQR